MILLRGVFLQLDMAVFKWVATRARENDILKIVYCIIAVVWLNGVGWQK